MQNSRRKVGVRWRVPTPVFAKVSPVTRFPAAAVFRTQLGNRSGRLSKARSSDSVRTRAEKVLTQRYVTSRLSHTRLIHARREYSTVLNSLPNIRIRICRPITNTNRLCELNSHLRPLRSSFLIFELDLLYRVFHMALIHCSPDLKRLSCSTVYYIRNANVRPMKTHRKNLVVNEPWTYLGMAFQLERFFLGLDGLYLREKILEKSLSFSRHHYFKNKNKTRILLIHCVGFEVTEFYNCWIFKNYSSCFCPGERYQSTSWWSLLISIILKQS